MLGRRLAFDYREYLALAAQQGSRVIQVHSVDSKRCLASAAGALLALLGTPETMEVFPQGAAAPIHTLESLGDSRELPLFGQRLDVLARGLDAGADLVARWCTHGSLPCQARHGDLQDLCTTPKEASDIVERGQRQFCEALLPSDLSWLGELLSAQKSGIFQVWSVAGPELTSVLVGLLGPKIVCE
ncbi:unnamed protein product, partial [Polarella glacialis]